LSIATEVLLPHIQEDTASNLELETSYHNLGSGFFSIVSGVAKLGSEMLVPLYSLFHLLSFNHP
jgi:hypothetical protein